MQELEPCPFCGGIDLQVSHLALQSFVIWCSTCGAESGFAPNKKDVIELWNTRSDATGVATLNDETDKPKRSIFG